MPSKSKVSEDQLRRVCRMYSSDRDAMVALGWARDGDIRRFHARCAELGIKPPSRKNT
jgi:hypothetical protein